MTHVLRTRAILSATRCLALGMALAATHAWADDVVLDHIVAVVNDSVVLESDVQAEIRFLEDQARSNRQNLPAADVLRERVIERLIDTELQRQRADELGVSVDASTVNRAVERVARNNNLDPLEFRDVLRRQGFDYGQFRNDLERQLLTQRLIQRDVETRVRVSAQEIDDFLDAEANDARERQRYRIGHILIGVAEGASDAVRRRARERADAIVERLRGGEDFASVAAAESDGARALEGGDLGWRSLSEVPRFLADALRGMQPGDISEPLSSPNGLHIARLAAIEAQSDGRQSETLARHIFLTGDDPAHRETLEELRERIEAGEPFARLAAEFSDDTNSADNGGELPWFSRGQMPVELEQVAAELEPGVISAPFRSQFGWHILEVLEKRDRELGDSDRRRQAEAALLQSKIEQESERWIRELRDESFIERFDPPGETGDAAAVGG